MILTNIEQQAKNPKRFSVFIDGDFAFGLDGTDILYYKLKIGEEISCDKKELIIADCVRKKAMDKAVRLLSVRARSEKELRSRLEENEYGSNAIEYVMSILTENGYIDDRKFAEEFIAGQKRKGFGKTAIAHKLREKGISRQISDETLKNEDNSDTERCIALLNKKYGSCSFDRETAKKAFSWLGGRGFSFDTVKAALKARQEDNSGSRE